MNPTASINGITFYITASINGISPAKTPQTSAVQKRFNLPGSDLEG